MKSNGVRHTRCAPYHPVSNGLAERFVQSVKQALKSSVSDGRLLIQRLSSFLLTTYRTTPHATAGVAPCSLFLGRSVRTRLDLLRPNRRTHVLSRQADQKEAHDRRAQDREWFVGQSVMARNLRPGPDWVSGVIVERLGPLSYLIETESHQYWKRHADQLKAVDPSPLTSTEFDRIPDWDCAVPTATPEAATVPVAATPVDTTAEATTPQPRPPEESASGSATASTDTARRYPVRARQAVERYEPTWWTWQL